MRFHITPTNEPPAHLNITQPTAPTRGMAYLAAIKTWTAPLPASVTNRMARTLAEDLGITRRSARILIDQDVADAYQSDGFIAAITLAAQRYQNYTSRP